MAEWHFYASGPDKINEKKLWTTGTDAEKKLITDKNIFKLTSFLLVLFGRQPPQLNYPPGTVPEQDDCSR